MRQVGVDGLEAVRNALRQAHVDYLPALRAAHLDNRDADHDFAEIEKVAAEFALRGRRNLYNFGIRGRRAVGSVLARDEPVYVAAALGVGRRLSGTLAYQLKGKHARLPERSEARLVSVIRHLVPAARGLGVCPGGIVKLRELPAGGVGAHVDMLLVVQLHRVRDGVPVAGILAHALGRPARNYLLPAAQIDAVENTGKAGAQIAESVSAGIVGAHGDRVSALFEEWGYVDFIVRPRLLEAARGPFCDVFPVDVKAVILVGGNVHHGPLRNFREFESFAE